jgi:RoxA-like, cytochrome c-like/Cytochrome c
MNRRDRPDAVPDSGWKWCRRLLIVFVVLILVPGIVVVLYLAQRFLGDSAVTYANMEDQFKYGSTGGEHEFGFPYWIFQALPQVCAEHLPGKGYASLGFIYEPNKDLPVGMSQRRYQGINRTFINCAACHTSTVRDTPQSASKVYTGMPANTFDIMAFQKFFFSCGVDGKFSKEYIVPEVRRLLKARGEDLDLIDRYAVYPLAIWIMREQLLRLRGRFEWVLTEPLWGPGRTDTFNPGKAGYFHFDMKNLPERELKAPVDFPSIWNQRQKTGMHLHWDGNNGKVEERNKNAAFGTGATPPTIDLESIGRIETWLLDLKPPRYPYSIDGPKAERGAKIYADSCAACHGANGQQFAAKETPRETDCLKPGESEDIYGYEVGKLTPIAEIGTDRRRLDSFSYLLAVNMGTPYAGSPYRFCHYRKTFGYANLPLDGLWLRAPYLHNGSVPTLHDLLEPGDKRPAQFYRGYDVYDPAKVGFVSNVAEEAGRKYFQFDTTIPGNGNAGHEGKRYGTELSADDKAALVEFLKTF